MVKNLPINAGDIRDVDSIPGSGRSPAGGHGNPLQYSCLENTMDRGTWWATVPYCHTWIEPGSPASPALAGGFFAVSATWEAHIHMYITHFPYPSIDKHLDCFYNLAIVNNTTVNMGMQTFLTNPYFSSFRCVPQSGMAASYNRKKFKINWQCIFFWVLIPVYFEPLSI